MASIAAEMAPTEHQSPPQSSMSSLEALIQAAQFLEDSESSKSLILSPVLIQASTDTNLEWRRVSYSRDVLLYKKKTSNPQAKKGMAHVYDLTFDQMSRLLYGALYIKSLVEWGGMHLAANYGDQDIC